MLQTLIDAAPDHLWVKDINGAFVVANMALAANYGRANASEMIGLSDFDIHEREQAQGFYDLGQDILRSGQSMIDREESVVSSSGAKKWLVSTKAPLRNDRNETCGLVGVGRDITELRAARAAANERRSLQALIDRLPDNLWVKDVDSRFVIVNQATAARIGVAGPADLIGKTDLELLPPEIAYRFYADEQKIVRSCEPMIDIEDYVFDSSGGRAWISTTKAPLRDDSGEIFGVAGVSRDITERKPADALRDGPALILEMIAMSAPLADVLEHLVHLMESQLNGIIGSVLLPDETGNRLRHGAAPSLPEAYVKAIDGLCIGPNAGPSGVAAYRREAVFVADIMADPLGADYKDLAAAHGIRSCWSTPILSHQGAILGAFAMYSKEMREPTDAEVRLVDSATRIAGIAIERKLAEDRIHFMSNHDALTELPDRALLADRLNQAMQFAQRYDRWVMVASVDLDNFRLVNDTLGHCVGDQLLTIVAHRIRDCVKEADTVVRLGGDEFCVLLVDQPRNAELITPTLQKLREAICEPARVGGRLLQVTGSIGLANFPDDGKDADALLANAAAAMYRAKEIGRDNFQFYTPEINARVHEKFRLQEELRNAIAHKEFFLLFQPQVDLRSGRIFAVEALIRWRDPSHGVVPPDRFIPIAEESGLIAQIGDWALRSACKQNKAWQDAGLAPINISLNVSARQFQEKNWVRCGVGALQESGLEARYLELELTESLITQDVDQAVTTMKELQRLGVQLSIDDFGTGYSSLSALKTFPVARLKIDKSFVRDLPHDENDRAVVAAVISLGQKLNLRVIAEGVETDEQLAFLRDNNCAEMQGYLFSKPIPPAEIEDLLKRRPAWAKGKHGGCANRRQSSWRCLARIRGACADQARIQSQMRLEPALIRRTRNNMKATTPSTDGVRLSALSPASYKILGLLQKGCAYSVRGAWRFRGLRGCVNEQAFLSLLANGLAERVETDRYAQVRITPAGRSISAESR
ncbi:MAG: EAL domain-containing protein [Roseiarcus sp.]